MIEIHWMKTQMHQLWFAIIAKYTFAIFLWEWTELGTRLPAIAGFIMLLLWVVGGGSDNLQLSDVESVNFEHENICTFVVKESTVSSQQSLVNSL